MFKGRIELFLLNALLLVLVLGCGQQTERQKTQGSRMAFKAMASSALCPISYLALLQSGEVSNWVAKQMEKYAAKMGYPGWDSRSPYAYGTTFKASNNLFANISIEGPPASTPLACKRLSNVLAQVEQNFVGQTDGNIGVFSMVAIALIHAPNQSDPQQLLKLGMDTAAKADNFVATVLAKKFPDWIVINSARLPANAFFVVGSDPDLFKLNSQSSNFCHVLTPSDAFVLNGGQPLSSSQITVLETPPSDAYYAGECHR